MKQIVKMLCIIVIATLALVSLPTPSASQVDNTNLTLPARVIHITGQVCPSDEVRVSERNKIAEDVRGLLHTTTATACQTQSSPAVSCSALPTSCPSGYYWIRTSNGSAVQVYCDMDRVCGCNVTGGWTRIAYLNMTDPKQQCPQAWREVSSPKRTCQRTNVSCESTRTLITLVYVAERLHTSMATLMLSAHTLIDRHLLTPLKVPILIGY